MCFRKFKEVAVCFIQASVIAGITIFAASPFSCKVSTEGIQIVGGDYTPPVLEELKVIDENYVQLNFSKKVKMTGAVLSPYVEGISNSTAHSTGQNASSAIKAAYGEYGKIPVEVELSDSETEVLLKFQNPTLVGKVYELYGVVEDECGNSLTFTAGFTGFNPKVPLLLITEVQIKYTKAKLKAGDEYRGEFVEILALEDGNLAGLRLVSAYDGEKKAYDFPGIEVHKDEVFLVHLRNAGNGCVSELEDNLDAATGMFSAAGIRDLWADNNSAHFNDDDDVIIIEDKATGKVIDGFMYSTGVAEEWKEASAAFAKRLLESGITDTDDISGAVLNAGTTPKKSFQRNINKSEEWEVKDVTPGTL